MKFLTGLLFTCLFACLVAAISANAQGPTPEPPPPPSGNGAQRPARDPAREEPLYDQLAKIAPKAVETFKKATAALDRANYPDAIKLYDEVLKQAPDFEPALRRLGYCLVYTGKRTEGLKLSKKALDINRSPENLLGHASNVAGFGVEDFQPSESERTEALALAREAFQKNKAPDDSSYAAAYTQLALSTGNMTDFDAGLEALKDKFPDLAITHYFNGIDLADTGDFSGGEAELKKAEELGFPHEEIQPVLAFIAQAKQKEKQEDETGSFFGLGDYLYLGLYIVGAWALGLLALFIAGKILSAKTLRSIENSDPNDITGGGHSGLRKVYRYIISIAGIYWYISQPVVMLLVAVATAGGILFFFWIGTIPIKLVLIIGFIGAATLFVMIKSLFVRVKTEDPGRALTEEEAPGMWATVRDVAATVNTRPVNEIRITPGTDLAVYERGGIRLKMQDKADRILILGTAVLNDFDQNAFRAVLAHEYGHFSNRDTAGGDVAFRVNEHIFRLAGAMGQAGTATVYNIGFQFLRLYHFLFRRITHGATRLQEILADRVAVYQYGAEAFRKGLTHVVRREIEFSHLANGEINASYTGNRALQNLYELKVDNDTVKGQLDVQFNETINRPTTEDDTHPSPADRFKLAEKIRSRDIFPVRGQVWDLFKDRDALTNEMNALIEQSVRGSM